MYYNTIILKKGCATLSKSEYTKFEKGDTIWGVDSEPVELKRYSIDHEQEAKEELAKYNCTYSSGYVWNVEEYALEYCDCDADGEFIQGSDFDLAKVKDEH